MSTATTTKRRRQGATHAVTGTRSTRTVGAASRRRGDTETKGQGENPGFQFLKAMVGAVLASPSLRDGSHGARDAGLLATYAERTLPQLVRGGVVRVQCTSGTEAMLKRAGIKRPVRFEAYEVVVIKDRFNRLQLSPATKGGAES
jgi:hypothetical protein